MLQISLANPSNNMKVTGACIRTLEGSGIDGNGEKTGGLHEERLAAELVKCISTYRQQNSSNYKHFR